MFLEEQLRSQLHLPHVRAGSEGGNPAEIRGAEYAVRLPIIDVAEDVEHFHAELDPHRIAGRHILDERDVRVC